MGRQIPLEAGSEQGWDPSREERPIPTGAITFGRALVCAKTRSAVNTPANCDYLHEFAFVDELPTSLEPGNRAVTPPHVSSRRSNNPLGIVINKLTDHPSPRGAALRLETQNRAFAFWEEVFGDCQTPPEQRLQAGAAWAGLSLGKARLLQNCLKMRAARPKNEQKSRKGCWKGRGRKNVS